MFHIVLFQPEIPPNTGNIMRLCANAPATLHLIEPLGFSLDDKRLRRAGMDYRAGIDFVRHASLEGCQSVLEGRRWVALSTRGQRRYDQWQFQPEDVLLFGSESRGLPDVVRDQFADGRCLVIPQRSNARSLNLSNSVAVVLYEAWRQTGFAD
ncbi:MAG: tRNA (cytidine(34)-2'-O)-methyltransferase [Wenzhouxiangella sp.]|nr:tRNA (cytidine(34)-2'-O)-methyltransferase [Wenzhouxiangella sp.]